MSVRPQILIVDDELPLAELLAEILSDFESEIVTDSKEALKLLLDPSLDYKAVFCDLNLPAISGADLYRQVREKRPGNERRFIFVTAGACSPESKKFLEGIPNPTLTKPFDVKTVLKLASLI